MAARFDVSLAWLVWVGAVASLRSLVEWSGSGAFERVRELARRLADGVGAAPPASTLVCLPATDVEAARRALDEAGIRASVRGAGLRLAPHVYNTEGDIEAAINAIGSRVAA